MTQNLTQELIKIGAINPPLTDEQLNEFSDIWDDFMRNADSSRLFSFWETCRQPREGILYAASQIEPILDLYGLEAPEYAKRTQLELAVMKMFIDGHFELLRDRSSVSLQLWTIKPRYLKQYQNLKLFQAPLSYKHDTGVMAYLPFWSYLVFAMMGFPQRSYQCQEWSFDGHWHKLLFISY